MRIVWFTDPHVQTSPPAKNQFCVQPFWTLPIQKLFDRLAKVCKGADALIMSGDASHGGKPKDVARFFTILDRIAGKKPVFMVLGNHDVSNDGGEDCFAREAARHPNVRFGEGIFELGALDLVLLNNQYLTPDGSASKVWPTEIYPVPAMPAGQASRLNEMLGGNKDRKAIVVVHCPTHALPGQQSYAPSILHEGNKKYQKTLEAVLDKHRRVRAVYSGHVHFNSTLRMRNGRVHQTLSSLIEYPFNIRVIEAAGGILRSRMISLADEKQLEIKID
jgi:predicted MPP superfamily phosphohydrolase